MPQTQKTTSSAWDQIDQRDWFYRYRVYYDVGYRNTVGFGSDTVEQKFHDLIGEARDKLHALYKLPAPDIIMLNCMWPIYFCGWYATVDFREWGPNRTNRNWPHDVEVVDRLVNYVVEGMGGKVTNRELLEMPIELKDASARLLLPLQKEQPDTKPEITEDENSPF